jgi:hypothetical protein
MKQKNSTKPGSCFLSGDLTLFEIVGRSQLILTRKRELLTLGEVHLYPLPESIDNVGYRTRSVRARNRWLARALSSNSQGARRISVKSPGDPYASQRTPTFSPQAAISPPLFLCMPFWSWHIFVVGIWLIHRE